MKTMSVILGLLFIFIATAQAEGIYKWVDENGQVHYGERPPEDRSAKEMRMPQTPANAIPADPAERKRKQERLLRAFDEERRERNEAAAEKAEQEAERRRNCTIAKDRLRNYKQANYLYNLDEKGERVIFTDEQRKQAEAKLQQMIDKWCQ